MNSEDSRCSFWNFDSHWVVGWPFGRILSLTLNYALFYRWNFETLAFLIWVDNEVSSIKRNWQFWKFFKMRICQTIKRAIISCVRITNRILKALPKTITSVFSLNEKWPQHFFFQNKIWNVQFKKKKAIGHFLLRRCELRLLTVSWELLRFCQNKSILFFAMTKQRVYWHRWCVCCLITIIPEQCICLCILCKCLYRAKRKYEIHRLVFHFLKMMFAYKPN